MEENDITLADMILASLMSESEHIMLYVIHEKATDEAQAQRVILSLCSYGAAHETDIHLEKTDKTANLLKKKIYLLSFLMVIVGISCEKETVITISNESFEEYFRIMKMGNHIMNLFDWSGIGK